MLNCSDPQIIVNDLDEIRGYVKVVDMGTMDGVFLKEWRKKYPRSKIIGFDLESEIKVGGTRVV